MNFARAGLVAAGLEHVRSDSLSKDYKRRIAADRTPVSASIELTYRCNLHCGHCYCPPGDRSRELTGEEIRSLIDRLADLGTLFLLMTGGDPLLRKDFAALYRHAKERGMLVTVFTNGTLIDDRIADLWEELPPYLVEISLYGLTRGVYEKVVAVPGSYDRCLAGISRVLASAHPLALKCPVTRDNAHEIAGIAQFAKDLGVDFRYDPVILATMDGGHKPHVLRLAAEEIVAFEAKDIEKDRAWRKYLAEEPQPELDPTALFSCGAGKNSLHIDPYGNVQVCLMVKNFKHSLRERDLAEIYFEEFPKILSLKREEGSKCGSCKSRAICNNCPGIALWETETNHANVDFLCTLTGVREQTYRGALEDASGEPGSGGGACGGCGSGCKSKSQGASPLLQIGGVR
ncbi:MAG TPA: radical SAM protein [Myxococcota bacterium]|nr:radical SAM protein [Myxococcota bacterium]